MLSSRPASLSLFSFLSAIRFFSMINLIREVLRGEKQVGISRIKNMRFPEMHIYSILLISMASSDMPLEFDSGKLQNPKYSTVIPMPSEKMYGKGIISAHNRLDSRNHPLTKSGSCKVGLGIILSSLADDAGPFDNILFGLQVKGDFPKLLGSSVEIIITSENKVDAPNPSSFHEPFDSSSVNLTNNVDMTNVSGEDVPIQSGRNSYICREWPCVFAMNQRFDSVTQGSLFTNSNGSLESQQLTICIKHKNAGFLTLEEIENTDNYTRATNYLPYPKVTHMYNNCILEFPPRQSSDGNFNKKKPGYPPRVHNLRRWSLFSSNENFLKNCETCGKSLEGIDVYIYRGESSFCSLLCRYWKVKAERDFARLTRMVPTAPSSNNKKPVFYVGAKPPGA